MAWKARVEVVKNNISEISCRETGNSLRAQQEIEQAFVDFYQELYMEDLCMSEVQLNSWLGEQKVEKLSCEERIPRGRHDSG